MAESLGHERREAVWHAQSDCRACPPSGGHHAPYVEQRFQFLLDAGSFAERQLSLDQKEIPEFCQVADKCPSRDDG